MHDLGEIPLTRIDGSSDRISNHSGNVLLVVNVASKCGLTPQYEGLERLFSTYNGRGFEVLGFPANDFGAQEPGSEEEISAFCSLNYGVSFPLYAKANVAGPDKQPIFAALTRAMPEKLGSTDEFRERLRSHGMTPTEDPEVLWNFEKFLIGRDGLVVARFAPSIEPEDTLLIETLEKELGR